MILDFTEPDLVIEWYTDEYGFVQYSVHSSKEE